MRSLELTMVKPLGFEVTMVVGEALNEVRSRL